MILFVLAGCWFSPHSALGAPPDSSILWVGGGTPPYHPPQWRRLTAFVPPQVVTPGALQLYRDLMQAVVSKIILRPCAILPLKCSYCAFVLYQTAI